MPHRSMKKRPSAMKVAKKALALARRTGGKKFHNIDLGDASVINTWQLIHFTGVAEGDTSNTRDGEVIGITDIEIRLQIQTASAIDNMAGLRYVLIQDKQANGLTFTVNDVWTSNNEITSVRDWAFASRFRILWDSAFSVQEFTSNATTFTGRTVVKRLHYSRPLKVQYTGGSSAVSDISSGSIYLAYLSDRASNQPDQQGRAQIRFISHQN